MDSKALGRPQVIAEDSGRRLPLLPEEAGQRIRGRQEQRWGGTRLRLLPDILPGVLEDFNVSKDIRLLGV